MRRSNLDPLPLLRNEKLKGLALSGMKKVEWKKEEGDIKVLRYSVKQRLDQRRSKKVEKKT